MLRRKGGPILEAVISRHSVYQPLVSLARLAVAGRSACFI